MRKMYAFSVGSREFKLCRHLDQQGIGPQWELNDGLWFASKKAAIGHARLLCQGESHE